LPFRIPTDVKVLSETDHSDISSFGRVISCPEGIESEMHCYEASYPCPQLSRNPTRTFLLSEAGFLTILDFCQSLGTSSRSLERWEPREAFGLGSGGPNPRLEDFADGYPPHLYT